MIQEQLLLQDICQSSEMGCEHIERALKDKQNEMFRSVLKDRHRAYSDLYHCAKDMLGRFEEVYPQTDLRNGFGSPHGMLHESQSNEIKALIEESTRCMARISEFLENETSTNERVQLLAQRLLEAEQQTIFQLKSFF